MIVGVGANATSVPAAFTFGQWTLADSPSVGGDKLVIDIDISPSDGGSAITKYQFKVDPGAWQDLASGAALGPRTVTVLAGALASVQVRAVNGIGPAATPSDTKSVTPTALVGPTNTVAPAMTGTFAVGQVITVGNGTWSVTPDEYERRWTYGSTLLPAATASTYTVQDFTFGQNLFAEVRCRQTGGAWSNWITATGAQTVIANPQNVVWASEFTSFSLSPRAITTPAVTAGDLIVFIIKAAAGSLTTAMVQADFSLGTMQYASGFANGEAVAVATYVCPTTQGGGLSFTGSNASAGCEIAIIAINMGPHLFSTVSGGGQSIGSAFNFPALTAPANSKVLWVQAHKTGVTNFTLSPTPPAKSTSLPNSQGGNIDSGDLNTFWYFVRTQTSAGSVATQTITPNNFNSFLYFSMSFTPQIVAPSVPEGKYVADINGAGIAKTSTITTMVTDGVTLNLAASRKVGNYISNNLGLGTLFIYDAGSGVTVNSHTGSVAWKNPSAIITEDADGQPFVNEIGMLGPVYDAGLIAATPISLVAGDTLLISVNQSPAVNSSYVSKFVTVHVVGTIPYDDEFAPPLVWDASLGARPRFRFSDWNQGARPLPSMTAQSNAPSIATVQATYNRRTIDLVNSWNSYSISATLHQPNYGRDMINWEKNALAVLCADYTLAQKTPILIGYLQRGIDGWGVFKSGKAQNAASIWHAANGGQKTGRKLPIVFAGHMLGVNAMRDVDTIAAAADFQEDGMAYFMTQALIDYTQNPPWNGTSYSIATGRPNERYVQGMLNGQSLNYPMPEWTGGLYDADNSYAFTLKDFNAHWNGHGYRFTGNHEDSTSDVLLAAAMGLKTYWGNDAWFMYQRRHYEMKRNGVDPWRLAGGAVNRYAMVNTTGAGSYFNIGPPPSDSTGWAERMFAAHINSVAPYPW